LHELTGLQMRILLQLPVLRTGDDSLGEVVRVVSI